MSAHISIIVPAYNAAETLPFCLKALQQDSDGNTEIVVVNDGSTDRTAEIAREHGVTVLSTKIPRSGPAAARNLGASQAFGEILFFVDADVVIHAGSISLVRNIFQDDVDLAAVFGSYDDAPSEKNFLSQYKNLLHHFVHQTSNEDAQTFWAGCGAIRKSVFTIARGFDSDLYSHPSIEDIELGLRLKNDGHRIRLLKNLQGKHLKRWTPLSLLKTDLFHRAYPWSTLIAESGEIPDQLNLQHSHRISSLLAAGFFLLSGAAILLQSLWLAGISGLMGAFLILLNRELYSFFARKKGLLFTVGAILWHMVYYVYSAIIFVYCWVRFGHRRSEKRSPEQSENIGPHRNTDKPRY